MAHTLPKYEIRLNERLLSAALMIPEEVVVKEFRDGRVTSRFSEHWAAAIYDFEKAANTNEAVYDGTIHNPLIGTKYISIKSPTKGGVKFQQSKFVGMGRKCTKRDLLDSVRAVDFILVVDIVDFPIVYFMPVEGRRIHSLVDREVITCSGVGTRERFYQVVFDCALGEIEVDFYSLER